MHIAIVRRMQGGDIALNVHRVNRLAFDQIGGEAMILDSQIDECCRCVVAKAVEQLHDLCQSWGRVQGLRRADRSRGESVEQATSFPTLEHLECFLEISL